MKTTKWLSLCLAVGCLSVSMSNHAQTDTIYVPIIDACKINPVFCGSGGRSDVPGFISGSAGFLPEGGNRAKLSLTIKGSLPGVVHSVFLCPGAISNTGGFVGCRNVGSFTTNRNGQGSFSKEILDGTRKEKVVAINVPKYQTVLANCPNEQNARCKPKPLQSVSVRTPIKRCSIAGGATGSRKDGASVYNISLYGPEDKTKLHTTKKFDSKYSYKFSGLPEGKYWIVLSTRADIMWGPQPSQRVVNCKGNVANINFNFQ